MSGLFWFACGVVVGVLISGTVFYIWLSIHSSIRGDFDL